MSDLADKVQRDLVAAIDNDDLVLPTLPEVAMQIRRAAEDPEISVSNLSKVIGRDTALSARLSAPSRATRRPGKNSRRGPTPRRTRCAIRFITGHIWNCNVISASPIS
mgnify:CR=1 FL=1